MKMRFSRLRRISGWLCQGAILVVLVFMVATLSVDQRTKDPHTYKAHYTKQAAVHENSSSLILSKAQCTDWTLTEIVHDLPQVILKNSLTIWTNDYTRNPFYALTNIHAP